MSLVCIRGQRSPRGRGGPLALWLSSPARQARWGCGLGRSLSCHELSLNAPSLVPNLIQIHRLPNNLKSGQQFPFDFIHISALRYKSPVPYRKGALRCRKGPSVVVSPGCQAWLSTLQHMCFWPILCRCSQRRGLAPESQSFFPGGGVRTRNCQGPPSEQFHPDGGVCPPPGR